MRKKEQSNLAAPSSRRFTLPKSHILRGRRNFKRLFTDSSLIKSPSVNLRFASFSSQKQDFLVGFIAPKKTGNAVQRNHSKRLMREAYRLNKHLIDDLIPDSVSGMHIALLAKHALTDFHSVQADIVTLLEELRNRILNDHQDPQNTLNFG